MQNAPAKAYHWRSTMFNPFTGNVQHTSNQKYKMKIQPFSSALFVFIQVYFVLIHPF
jgi:hypothetical protein